MAVKSKTSFAKTLGKRIKKAREDQGLSLKHFEALENAVDRHALSRIEQGKVMPSAYTLYKICHVLKISLADLLGGTNL